MSDSATRATAALSYLRDHKGNLVGFVVPAELARRWLRLARGGDVNDQIALEREMERFNV